ncbi:MAG TPA: outer membrane lipoprotein carrier protein LolA [Terriglobia bacterium]|jgi:outer membrane lipoprotein carrier protein|nr:outer membrane lipoprotein carrier protein LolA [Terriglobia bacterium]
MQILRHHEISRARLETLLCVSCGVLLSLSVRCSAAHAQGNALEDYIHRLESSYRGVRTLQAEFTQTYVWGGRTRIESGTVIFAKGGLMRWDYREPKEKIFLSDGKKLLLYLPEEKQLTRSPVKSSDDIRVPFRLLLSRLSLRKVFSKIEFADPALPHDQRDRVLRAFPRHGYEQDYRDVLMEVTPDFDIKRLLVSYPDRSTMEFVFDRIKRNIALNPRLFRFEPPPGTEVIEQH